MVRASAQGTEVSHEVIFMIISRRKEKVVITVFYIVTLHVSLIVLPPHITLVGQTPIMRY